MCCGMFDSPPCCSTSSMCSLSFPHVSDFTTGRNHRNSGCLEVSGLPKDDVRDTLIVASPDSQYEGWSIIPIYHGYASLGRFFFLACVSLLPSYNMYELARQRVQILNDSSDEDMICASAVQLPMVDLDAKQ